MSKRIYLSPSSQPANIYAAGDTNEQTQCRRIALAAAAAMSSFLFIIFGSSAYNEPSIKRLDQEETVCRILHCWSL